jgi:RNA polymerase sigma factor for flagellar operon FliA
MAESSTTRSVLPADIVRQMAPSIQKTATHLARRLPPHVHRDDLIGAGLLALVKAFIRFDPGRGGEFETYASSRIRGAMLDEIRSSDYLSREQRSKVNRIVAAMGAQVDASEVAIALGFPSEASLNDESLNLPEVAGEERVDECLCREEARYAVSLAVKALPPRLFRILELHYEHDLTLREIGEAFGVSESRICQLESEAIRKVRERCWEHTAQYDEAHPQPRRRRGRAVQRRVAASPPGVGAGVALDKRSSSWPEAPQSSS